MNNTTSFQIGPQPSTGRSQQDHSYSFPSQISDMDSKTQINLSELSEEVIQIIYDKEDICPVEEQLYQGISDRTNTLHLKKSTRKNKKGSQRIEQDTERCLYKNDHQRLILSVKLGYQHYKLKEEKEALKYMEEALEISKSFKQKYKKGEEFKVLYKTLAEIYFKNEDFIKSTIIYGYASDVANGDLEYLNTVKIGRGEALCKTKEFKEAQRVLKEALEYWEKQNNVYKQQKIQIRLMEIYHKTGKMKEFTQVSNTATKTAELISYL